jgi:putative beta-lysine N-acetyltransferase
MMFDKIEIISKSLVQHGPNNDRVYLMKIHAEEKVETLIDQLYGLAILKRYTKIFVKVPENMRQLFLDHNFKLEATVPNLYQGVKQGCFLGKTMDASRGFLTKKEKTSINEVKDSAIATNKGSDYELPTGYEIIQLGENDVPNIANIYKQVFQFYPFPIFKESYLLDTMHSNVQYFGIHYQGELIAVSSAEMDVVSSNVEMTDFATLPAHRGRNLSYHLLTRMMSQMVAEGIKTAYTIARANSYGMNKTFARQGFQFGGTLVNNTLIGDTIESMNVWYKKLK